MGHQPLRKTMNIIEMDTNLQNCFKFNSFSEDVEYKKVPCWDSEIRVGKALDDDDLSYIRTYLTMVHDFEPSKTIVGEACLMISKKYKYHPVKQYIQKEEWDNVNRLEEWMIKSLGCDDNKYIRDVSAKFLIAAVNRIYNPGCKFDHMMILEGAQGMGKSTLVEELASLWYLDTNFEHKDKDLVDSMRKAFLIEISELSGMNQKDVQWLKSFLAKKVDRVRLAYASKTKDFKRKSVFMGTYNPSGNNNYLRDDTGNRRFYPVECRKVDINYVKEVKQQLWAEAYSRYKDGEIYYIEHPEALAVLKTMHQDRETEGPTYYKIRAWLKASVYSEVEMNQIIEQCLKINTDGKNPKDLQSTSIIVGIIMKKLGWMKGNNDNRHKYYKPEDNNSRWT